MRIRALGDNCDCWKKGDEFICEPFEDGFRINCNDPYSGEFGHYIEMEDLDQDFEIVEPSP